MLRTIMVGFVARFNQSARRQKKPWSIAHWLALGCAAGLLLSIGVQAAYICLGLNWHPVVAGQCYRCGQPSAASLRELVQQHGIRTVINLRGSNPEQEWYQEECRATESVGVVRFDVSLDGFHPPLPRELRKLVDYLEQAELPLLLHCHSGSDRSAGGWARAMRGFCSGTSNGSGPGGWSMRPSIFTSGPTKSIRARTGDEGAQASDPYNQILE
jgi:protein tyrosine phosphatase (PTP) superfamily phosphohydrolase (DUF442 family)